MLPRFSDFSFLWGVGLAPGKDDVVEFRNLTKFDKESCVDVQLRHNVTYFSTVIAFNMALNQKAVNASSNGGKKGQLNSLFVHLRRFVSHSYIKY